MKYENSMVTSQRVKELLSKSGMTFSELSRRLWAQSLTTVYHISIVDQI